MKQESNLRCECGEPLREFWLVNHCYYCCTNLDCEARYCIKDSGYSFRFEREIDLRTGKIGHYNHEKKKFEYKTVPAKDNGSKEK